MNIKRRCNKTGCRELINHHETYCREHNNITNREYNKFRRETDREYINFYSSKRWRDVRYQRLVRDNFICQRCLNDFQLYTEAQMCHHQYNRKDYPEHSLDIDTLISLCNACHEQVESRQEPKYVWTK